MNRNKQINSLFLACFFVVLFFSPNADCISLKNQKNRENQPLVLANGEESEPLFNNNNNNNNNNHKNSNNENQVLNELFTVYQDQIFPENSEEKAESLGKNSIAVEEYYPGSSSSNSDDTDTDALNENSIELNKKDMSSFGKDLNERSKQYRRHQAARWDIGFGKRNLYKRKPFLDVLFGKRAPKLDFGRKQYWDIYYGK
jgi:hypothetical protein